MKTSIKKMKLSDLIPTENNPRQIKKDDFERLKKSIKSFPKMLDIREIVVDEDNRILGGHQRVKALLANGEKEVNVKVVEGLSEEEKREFVIRDNIQNGEWDFDVLANEWDDLPLDDWGIDLPIADIEEEIVEDEAPEPPAEPKSKLGEIYQLGEHRLMCGDATDAEQVAELMDGEIADLVFTDPPYGMKKEADGVLNDNLNYDDLLDFNRQWIPLTFGALKDNGSWYCWGIDEPLMDIYSNILKPMAKENKITFRNLITWNKSYLQNGNTFNPFGASGSKNLRMYPTADEKCLFVMYGVQGFNNNQDNYFDGFEPIRAYLDAECEKCGGHKIWKQMLGNNMGHHYFTKSQWLFPTKEAYEKMQAFGKEYGAFGKEYEEIKKEYEEIKKEYEEIKKEFYSTRAYFINADNSNNVWNIEITKGKEKQEAGGHATPKPIALCSRAIKSSSREGELVLDVFGGSGSTLIACEQLGRKCYMMELDPHYVDVIIERWENLTGKKAKLIKEK